MGPCVIFIRDPTVAFEPQYAPISNHNQPKHKTSSGIEFVSQIFVLISVAWIHSGNLKISRNLILVTCHIFFIQSHQISQMLLNIFAWFDYEACFILNKLLQNWLQTAIKITLQRVLSLGVTRSETLDTPILFIVVCNLLIVNVANQLENWCSFWHVPRLDRYLHGWKLLHEIIFCLLKPLPWHLDDFL